MHDATQVDPDHRDQEILGHYAQAMQMRADGYAKDDRGELEDASADAIMQEHERMVVENWATTPSAVAGQLALALVTMDAERWLDRGLAEQGLAAVYQVRKHLDWSSEQLVNAAFELIHMEWDQTLAAYQQADADAVAMTETLKAIISYFKGQASVLTEYPRALYEQLEKHGEAVTGKSEAALDRLIRTLAPDWDEYKIKAEICAREGVTVDAGTWLARDANFLSAKIDPEILS